MKVRARSIIGKTTLGTIVWALGFAAFNAILFLVFGDCNFTVTAMSLSLVVLALRLLNFLYIAFLALFDREVEFDDDEESKDGKE